MNRRILISISFVGLNLMACCCGGGGNAPAINENKSPIAAKQEGVQSEAVADASPRPAESKGKKKPQAKPGKAPNDDLTLFIQRFGDPDTDDSTENDPNPPPFLTRLLVYRTEKVQAVFIPLGKADQRPVEKWKLIGFTNPETKKSIEFDDAMFAMMHRDKHPERNPPEFKDFVAAKIKAEADEKFRAQQAAEKKKAEALKLKEEADAARAKITADNLAKIKKGFTTAQVIAILGQPTTQRNIQSATIATWDNMSGTIITITFQSGGVSSKSLKEP